jgi:hypothetical protein
MYRKLIALGATALIAAAALAPTAASAKGGKGGHHWHGHGGLYVGLYPDYTGSDCYLVNKWVYTKHGRYLRQVEVCD